MAKKYTEFSVAKLQQMVEQGYKFINTHEQLSVKEVGFDPGTEFSHFLVVPYKDLPDAKPGTMRIDDPIALLLAKGVELVYYWVVVL